MIWNISDLLCYNPHGKQSGKKTAILIDFGYNAIIVIALNDVVAG